MTRITAAALLGLTLALPSIATANTTDQLRSTVDKLLIQMHQDMYMACARTPDRDGADAVNKCQGYAGELIGSLQNDIRNVPASQLRPATRRVADCAETYAWKADAGKTAVRATVGFLQSWSNCVVGK